MEKNVLHVSIIGGGIGGQAAASALQLQGVQVEVFEHRHEIGAALFQLITHTQFLGEGGRHFPVIDPFDGEGHTRSLLGWRSDRVAALSPVAVFSGEAHVHVLTCSMPYPVGEIKRDTLRACRFCSDGHDFSDLPA